MGEAAQELPLIQASWLADPPSSEGPAAGAGSWSQWEQARPLPTLCEQSNRSEVSVRKQLSCHGKALLLKAKKV